MELFTATGKLKKVFFLTTGDVRSVQWGTDHCKGTDNCRSEEYRCTHVDACVARTWIFYRYVPCHSWCTHRTSLIVKKLFQFFCGCEQFH
jgi:hypothetical protein